jgi:hypothetical protein
MDGTGPSSLLKHLIEKWGLGFLGTRTDHANSIGKLVKRVTPRTSAVERIELAPDQLRPPDPDLEEEAAKYISSHHKALALIGSQLQLELLREFPLTYAWLTYGLERLLHKLFGFVNPWVFRKAHERTKKHWSDFRERKRRKAIPRLASVIRDAGCSQTEKKHAIETLGLVANQRFHHATDPLAAAGEWLREAGQ